MTKIPFETAIRLCTEIRNEERHKPFAIMRYQCWGCQKFSGGQAAKMCGGIVECNRVVKRYERRYPERLVTRTLS